MTDKQDTRLTKIEESLYRVAHNDERIAGVLESIREDQKAAAQCRSKLRESFLELKGEILEMREVAVTERAAMTTQLTLRTKPGTIVKVVTAVVMAALAFFASGAPEAEALKADLVEAVQ